MNLSLSSQTHRLLAQATGDLTETKLAQRRGASSERPGAGDAQSSLWNLFKWWGASEPPVEAQAPEAASKKPAQSKPPGAPTSPVSQRVAAASEELGDLDVERFWLHQVVFGIRLASYAGELQQYTQDGVIRGHQPIAATPRSDSSGQPSPASTTEVADEPSSSVSDLAASSSPPLESTPESSTPESTPSSTPFTSASSTSSSVCDTLSDTSSLSSPEVDELNRHSLATRKTVERYEEKQLSKSSESPVKREPGRFSQFFPRMFSMKSEELSAPAPAPSTAARSASGDLAELHADSDATKTPSKSTGAAAATDSAQQQQQSWSWWRLGAAQDSDELTSTGFMLSDYTEFRRFKVPASLTLSTGRVMGVWHRQHAVEVKDYAPAIFADIRRRLGVSDDDYRRAWKIPLADIQPKLGAGRSGSLFVRSTDGRFLLKTLPPHEVEALRFLLQRYHAHLIQQPDSILIRFVGLLKFTWGSRVLYLFVSNNILHQPPSLAANHQIYDLKGRTPKPGKFLRLEGLSPDALSGRILKDNDVSRKWIVNASARKQLLAAVESDVRFLESNDLMDYSLLIGVHAAAAPFDCSLASLYGQPSSAASEVLSVGGAARVFSADKCEVFTFGIIDFLAVYGAKKRAANMLKSFLWEEEQLSTVPASYYSSRLLGYARKMITDQAREVKKQAASWRALPSSTEASRRHIRVFFSDCAIFRKHKLVNITRTVVVGPDMSLGDIKETALRRAARGMLPDAAASLMSDAAACMFFQIRESGNARPQLVPLLDPTVRPFADDTFQHVMLHSKVDT